MLYSLGVLHRVCHQLYLDPIQRTPCLTLVPFHSRLELRAGERAGSAVVPDRVLQRRLLRALRLPARPDHAEGLRLQVPLRRGDRRRRQGADRGRPRRQEGAQDRAQTLQGRSRRLSSHPALKFKTLPMTVAILLGLGDLLFIF